MPITAGVSGINRTVKRAFAGVSGVNREIRQGFAGVSGVNRLIFSSKVEATLTVSGKEANTTKDYLYSSIPSSSSYDTATWTVIFDRNLTFSAGKVSTIGKYAAFSTSNCACKWTIGSYQTSLYKDGISSASVPSTQAPIVTNKIAFHFSMNYVMDTNSGRKDAKFSGWIFYPDEYPNGIKIDMSKLVSTSVTGKVQSQAISFIEL